MPGREQIGELPVARLATGGQISLPVRILHGRNEGPTLWLSAAVHGDEVAGVEIIRRALARVEPRHLSGTILALPIVNVHGFLNGDRYLPDRRDLNRSFPGSEGGSLAARVAHLFMTLIVQRCEYGIDLHTGSDHRTNLPQVRADLDDPRTRELALAFGAPLLLHAKLRDGSMRAAATAIGAKVLLYEGGEAWRFDEHAIRVGTRGVLQVMDRLGMFEADTLSALLVESGVVRGPDESAIETPLETRSSNWVRARRSGIASLSVGLGESVEKGGELAIIHDSVGRRLSVVRASKPGVVIGHSLRPLVNQGDALVHLATP